jgi:predicted membrane protein
MEGKARFIFPVLATAVIVFIVSAVVTFANIGFRADFVTRWLHAFIIGWPFGAVLAFFALPRVHKLTTHIVALIEGKRV